MQAWLHDLQHLLAHGDAVVLVTVARVQGSAPREPGTKMLVTRDEARHTIGGGHLEWKAIETARQVLKDGARSPHMRRLERFALGPSLGQCCGGSVVLAFERLDIGDLGWVTSLNKRLAQGHSTVRSVGFGPVPDAVMLSDPEPGVSEQDCLLWDGAGFDESGALLTETIALREFSVVLFGAGHVGAAIVKVLANLPCRVVWVDERDETFPAVDHLPGNVTMDASGTPESAVDEAQPNSYFLVMTHNHALDLALAERILHRGDFAFFGMIGSHTKKVQFERKLAARGIDAMRIGRMTCPIGVPGIADKAPEMIAVSVAAQLLQKVEEHAARGYNSAQHPQIA
ncbi:xanthine dehydrogenase accessory protein XdhC [Caballeronia sordidicola]|uniref:Xanthine dehydrogenase accessory protein XdhC n=1 Tax=Caballeronia sordidicola TaxID=196367 RepID=A0A158F1X2_CABSO|nr:xanthine dehydrogenase accessory protein XdhC [Caballeronia sordidicola]SAL13389.1 xanthine dehydrogenase accessory protein XdhC [Caballeronia sordidicola]